MESLRVRRMATNGGAYSEASDGTNGDSNGSLLLLEMQTRETSGNILKLGLNYSGTYTDRISNRMTVAPGLHIRGWPLPGAEMTVNLELLNILRFDAMLHQRLTRNSTGQPPDWEQA